MKWIKKGQIFSPNNQYDWVKTHAMLPVTDHIKEDIFRVYFSGRDSYNVSRTGYIEIDIKNPQKILNLSDIKDTDRYKMWFCYAIGSRGYNMGYAESSDGYEFQRNDEKAGIELSSEGWDSEMICYPNVFKYKEEIYMFYCGNGYGKSGFGYATLIK